MRSEMENGVVFRKADICDASVLARLRRDTRNETFRGIYPDEVMAHFDLEASERMLANLICEDGEETYLIECGGTPAGYFGYGKPTYDMLPPGAVCLTMLYVLRAFQRCGIGRLVFEHMRDICRAAGKDRFYNGCNLHNENAVRFYRAMGGRVIGWCTADGNKIKDQIMFEHPVESDRPAFDEPACFK